MVKKSPKAEWDKMADYWNKDAGDTGVWHQVHDIDPVLFTLLGNVRGKKILEIGCGNGYFARLLARRGAKVTGVDVSEKLLQYAMEKEKLQPLGIEYFVCDAANLRRFRNRSFDIVVANMCLMDIADAENAVKEAGRVLKNRGRIVFSIIHPVFSYQKWAYIRRDGKKYFIRAILKYKTPRAFKRTLWSTGVKAMCYHRPVETYLEYLKDAGLILKDFKEIVSVKKLKQARKGRKEDKFKSSRYLDAEDRKLKKSVKKEIPDFLVISAEKK